jgi:glycosyltransferase involved in cell wall biosynthesis
MNIGGTEKSLLSLINALNKEEFDVTIICFRKFGGLLNQIPEWVKINFLQEEVDVMTYIKFPLLQIIRSAVKNVKFLTVLRLIYLYTKIKIYQDWSFLYQYCLRNYFDNNKYDIAVAYMGPHNFISHLVLSKLQATKKYQWIHFDVSKLSLSTAYGNKYYPKFDKVFCVSENAKEIFDNYFPSVNNKTTVFRNIVSKAELLSKAEQGETFTDSYKGLRIVTLGRLYKEKGQQMIPSVVARLKNEGYDFKWYLIGDGNLRNQIEEQINELGIEQNLVLLGSQLNPYAYLQDCNLYVQSSLHEGYCLTIHEAKIFEKPVVTTAVASASNLIVDEADGLIVPISVEGIYEGVKKMLVNPILMAEFSKSILAKDTTNEIKEVC